jgi:prolyl oligopeptidase
MTAEQQAGPDLEPETIWQYPHADRDDVADELHGVLVTDPYRYLEDPDGERTVAFVAAQNQLSAPYLANLASRQRFGELTTALVTAPRAGVPWERGGRYFVVSNPGGKDQDVLYTAGSVTELLGDARVLLDPNTLSEDGTTALSAARVSDDGTLLAYALSEAGSDWQTIKVRDVGSGEDRDDLLRWVKWVAPTWLPDGASFLYWRYPEPTAGSSEDEFAATFTEAMGVGQLVAHRLGTAQDRDEVVWHRPDQPEWMVDPWISPDDRWLILTCGPGTDTRTTLVARRLTEVDGGRTSIAGDEVVVVGELADAHTIVGSDGDTLYLRTERDAPRGRLVAVDLADPDAPWRELVPQHESDVLVSAHQASGGWVLVWSRDAAHHLEIRRSDGTPWAAPEIAGPVAVTAVHARPSSTEVFLGTSAFTRPVAAHRIELSGDTPQLEELSSAGAVELPAVSAQRRHARSADGTQVPMTVLARTDLGPGPHPTLLYGYGGFDIPVLPEFRAIFAAWVAAGGVLAVANLRGGGEFGAEWHRAGMLARKQNVFDDAIACAEQLIADGVTTAKQLAVHGRSNGGLLVGAVMTQRPDLFGAALPTVGVLDMLRFHKFTIGWAWISDYGDPDDPVDFPVLYAYSPLHALREDNAYPPTLICTGDHDDRVVPAHSLKFGAELQRCQAPSGGPVLLRVDTRAGHGMGKPAHALAAEYADQLAFAAEHTGLVPLED